MLVFGRGTGCLMTGSFEWFATIPTYLGRISSPIYRKHPGGFSLHRWNHTRFILEGTRRVPAFLVHVMSEFFGFSSMPNLFSSRKQLRRSLQRICSLENGSKYDIYPNKAWFQLNNWSPRSLKVRLGYLRETSKQSVFPFFTPPKNNMEPQKLGDLEDDVHVQSKG